MRFRKLRIAFLIACIIACVIFIVVVLGVPHPTNSADREWVLTATTIHLYDPDLVLSGHELQQFLPEYVVESKSDYASWSCPMDHREGTITIGDKEYAARFVWDKFTWNVLEVEGRGKTIKLYRNTSEYPFP